MTEALSRRALLGLGLTRLTEHRAAPRARAPTPSELVEAEWATGDPSAMSTATAAAAEALVHGADVRAGDRVLEIGGGDGSVARQVADRGAEMTTCSLTEVHALPFAPASFDVVLSAFGAMYAPHPRTVAAELRRVAGPAGVVGLANWSPAGFMGALLRLAERHGGRPAALGRPARWGRYEDVTQLLGHRGVEVEVDERVLALRPPDEASLWALLADGPGPVGAAARSLAAEAREAMRADLETLAVGAPAPGAPGAVAADYVLAVSPGSPY